MLGQADDAVVTDHLERCRAFLYAAEEDFGIVPVEAMAAGAPVIGYGRGGTAETVLSGKTGLLVNEQTPQAIGAAVVEMDANPIAPAQCRQRAEEYSMGVFSDRIDGLVAQAWNNFLEGGPWLPGNELGDLLANE